jgi:peptidoglycan-associated lipoprotein
MIKKLTLAFCALFLLSGCVSNKTGSRQMPTLSPTEEIALSNDFIKNVGDRVFFALDKSDLSDQSKDQLEKQAVWLKKHDNVTVIIEGHCDERGTREYNLALGERRAEAVRSFLAGAGIDSSRMDNVSYGKEKPAVVGDTEDAFSQNRRAVTVIK